MVKFTSKASAGGAGNELGQKSSTRILANKPLQPTNGARCTSRIDTELGAARG